MGVIFPKTALKTAIWVFFRGLKSKSGYFLGFSKKISDEHTYHFYIKSPPPRDIHQQILLAKFHENPSQLGLVDSIFASPYSLPLKLDRLLPVRSDVHVTLQGGFTDEYLQINERNL